MVVNHARSRRWTCLADTITDAESADDALSAMVAAAVVNQAAVAAALRSGVANGLDRATLLSPVHAVAVDRSEAGCERMIIAAMAGELLGRPRLDRTHLA